MSSIPSISELYEKRRIDNQLLRRDRIEAIYTEHPDLKAIDIELRSLALKKGMLRMKATSVETSESLKRELDLQEKKQHLLTLYGVDSNYLEEIYTCSACKDMGSIDGEYCSCYLQWKADLLFEHSPIYKIMEKENFNTFDFSLYSDKIEGSHRKSARDNIKMIYDSAKDYVEAFPNCRNLLLHGTSGVGKTFLTNCIAKELLQKGHTVCYLSATALFELMADSSFSNSQSKEREEQISFMKSCELLIIDDLGTEIHNKFSDPALFEIINDRHKKGLHILISTNLSMKQLGESYSERTVSRINEQFIIIPIYGSNIRLGKK